MFALNDVWEKSGIAPKDVNVMLHSPRHGDLQRHLPGLVRTRRQAMETYQAAHRAGAERTLSQGRRFVASFVKVGPGRMAGTSAMLFAGLYRNCGSRQMLREEIAADAEVRWLRQTFGAFGELDEPGWTHWSWFDLQLDDALTELQGRLLVQVRLTQNYVRLAENLQADVLAIHRDSVFDAAPPAWREMQLRAGVLQALPESWQAKLREWCGIYLLVDESDGARYVGSAYGEENLLGRWRDHVAGNHGITVKLKDRRVENFRFSILELVSPTADVAMVTHLEQTWMARLHTKKFGLNS